MRIVFKTSGERNGYLHYITGFLAVILVIATILLTVSYFERKDNNYVEDTDSFKQYITYKDARYRLKDELDTFLLIGLDKTEEQVKEHDSYNNDQLSDFVMLFVVDNDNSTCKAIHLNRDTIVEMDRLGVAGDKVGTTKKQLAFAHTYGNGKEVSCRNVATAVSRLFGGIKIDYYLSMTMDGVPVYNDLLGGVTVEINDDFGDFDSTLVKGETVTLLGEHALNFVRGRKDVADSTNINRMERQRTYIKSAFDKTRECIKADDGFAANAALKMADYIVSNCSATRMQNLLRTVSQFSLDNVLTIDGKSVEGEKYMEFYADEDALQKLLIDVFYEKDTKRFLSR